jgi:histidine triad (HIT) family protein
MSAPAYDDSNIFAKILRGEIPSHQVYEDEHAIAILDVMPQGVGHTLIIPKAPSRNLLDMGAHDLQSVALAVQRVARGVMKAFDAQGVTIMRLCRTCRRAIGVSHPLPCHPAISGCAAAGA